MVYLFTFLSVIIFQNFCLRNKPWYFRNIHARMRTSLAFVLANAVIRGNASCRVNSVRVSSQEASDTCLRNKPSPKDLGGLVTTEIDLSPISSSQCSSFLSSFYGLKDRIRFSFSLTFSIGVCFIGLFVPIINTEFSLCARMESWVGLLRCASPTASKKGALVSSLCGKWLRFSAWKMALKPLHIPFATVWVYTWEWPLPFVTNANCDCKVWILLFVVTCA